MRDTIVTLAKELIAIPSVTGEIEKGVEILEHIKKQLPGHDFQAFASNHYPSLLFSNQGPGTKKFKVILNAHLDVVPAAVEQFIPKVIDGKLYGRGAFDMKAAAAVNILLFKELAKDLSFPLGLQLVLDEETSGLNGTGYHVAKGVRGEFVMIGESNSNFKVGNISKGRKILKITTMGQSSHSAYAWLGQNALIKMYEVLDPIMKAFPHPTEETFNTTVNLTTIETDNPAINKIPGSCVAHLDVRYIPEEEKTIVEKIKRLLPRDALLEIDHVRPYQFVDPNNNYIRLLQETTKKVRNEDKPLRFAHATSDATFYSEVGCDAIEFGPVGGDAHNDHEWVDIESLVDYYQILKSFLVSLDKTPQP